MSKIIEKNVAELVVIGLFIIIFLSSCGKTHHLCDAYASNNEEKIENYEKNN